MNLSEDFCIPTNECQTPITKELLESLPEEEIEWFLDYINNVPYIKNLISPNRRRAKDMPHDDKGRVIVDFTNPHILENMNYFRPAALHYMKHGCYTFLRPNKNPNSEYYKWLHEEKRRCREGYVRESDGEWVTGYLYFFINYCPMMVLEVENEDTKEANRIEGFPELWEGLYLRFHYIYQARKSGKHAIELARRGAHPYFQPVFTPDGWKTWKEIKVGDKLFTSYGEECTVTDVPYDKVSPYYKITLRDGREVYATDDHLWNIIKKGKQITVNTAWLINNFKHDRNINERIPSGIECNCFIPKNNGIEMPYRKTKVDPYTFGLLLGDDCFRDNNCYFTQADSDLEVEKQYIPYTLMSLQSKYAYKVDIPNWKSIINDYSLYYIKPEHKFIPDEYKYNSREVRLNVLRGLLDNDGYVHGGVPVLTSTSLKLIEDTAFIARSLGYNTKWVKCIAGYKANGKYKRCNDCYELSIYGGPEVFNLPRKKALVKYTSSNAKSRRDKTCITNIEYMGEAPCKCVTVDSKDSCYLVGDFVTTHNCGKSFSLAAIMAHNFILGENEKVRRKTTTVLTAYQSEYLSKKDGTLSKFIPMIDFVEENMEWSKRRLVSQQQKMFWQSGYIDAMGREKGQLNVVMGVSSKDDEGKLRGKRGYILFEEMGSFPNLLSIYDTVRYGVEAGDYTFGLIYLVGTSAANDSDFESAKTLMYSPNGYNIYPIKNVYDKPKQGASTFGYFFPAFVNREGCYNKDGVSDVVKALIQILNKRYTTKYSANANSLVRVIAEMPITPAEAIIKVKNAFFPVTALTERLQQLDLDVNAYHDVYVGNLTLGTDGKVKFTPTSDRPIRKYGVENTIAGAIEIFEMPVKDSNGKVMANRYIVGHDPVDNDQAESTSLSSTFVLDLYTDKIVAEYTGRQQFADDNFEIVRLLCLFYNAKCLYEAHPYSQLVNTPKGPKLWKDIKIGDNLFSPTKGVVTVTDIPVDEEMDIYTITLQDGRTIRASDNHIWLVYKGTSKIPIEMTTKQMLEEGVLNKYNQHKFFIPEHYGVEYDRKDLPIDPYTMGLILAEGSIQGSHCTKNSIQIASNKEDMNFYTNNIPYNVKFIGKKGYSWHIRIPNCKDVMVSYNLYGTDSHTKFIPDDYKYSHRVQRMELLKGIMDGDGCAKTNGASILNTVSKKLAEDVLSLARSLGIKCWIQTSSKGVYKVALASEHKIFKLPRKVVEQRIYNPYKKGSKASAILNKTAIISIEYSHVERGKCVTVDSEDGLYLIGDYVVTHNCNKKGLYAYFQKMQSVHLLADTPEYLRDKQLVKYSSFGSNAKGVNANNAINNFANGLIRDWLLKPTTIVAKEDGEDVVREVPQLYMLRNRALIEELIAFNPINNFDRIRALGIVMIYREEKMILTGGNPTSASQKAGKDYLGNDDYFTRNYN